MPRLEIELTSRRDDGTWTWRAAGARQPKGTVSDELVPDGATTGVVVRADTEVDIDGITVVGITQIPPDEPGVDDTIEIVGSGRDEPGVVTNFAPAPARSKDRGPGGRRDRRRAGGEDRSRGRGRDRTRPAGDAPSRPPAPDGSQASATRPPRTPRSGPKDRDRPQRKPRAGPPPVPKRPKPKRLKPGRAHRDQLIQALPAEHQPIAEKLASGGLPAVRKAIAAQNAAARAEGGPEVPTEPLMAMAEELHPRMRAAEWRDRAEAAVADLDRLSLQDLRSVVAAANDVARDADSQALAAALREGLARQLEEAHRQWVDDVGWSLEAGRVVRALRLSSRPPDRKRSLPDDVLERLKVAGGQALNSETGPDRWALVLEAVSFSPVRRQVVPAGPPSSPSPELLEAVAKAAQRTPQIASLFGIDVKAPPGTPARAPSPPPPPAPPEATRPEPAPAVEDKTPEATRPEPTPAVKDETPEAPRRPPPAHDTPAEKVAEAALRSARDGSETPSGTDGS